MRQERRVTRLDRHYLRTIADVVYDDVGWIETVQLSAVTYFPRFEGLSVTELPTPAVT
jgi:hypothetical protein